MERLEQINLYLAFYKHLPGSHFLNAEAKDCTEKVYEHKHSCIWLKKWAFLCMTDRASYKWGNVLKWNL